MGSSMQQSRQGWSRSSIIFTAVAVVTLGSTIVSTGLGRSSYARFADTRSKLVGTQPVGAPLEARPAPVIPEYRLGKKDLEDGTATALVRVLERADRIDRGRTLVASLIAGKLFDGVADRVDADPTLLDDPRLSAAIRRTSFTSSRHPLEAERLHALGVLAGVPGMVPIRTAGFAEATATRAMEDVDVTLRVMESSAMVGDTKACEEASTNSKGLAKQVTVGPSICKHAAQIVESGKRLQRLQARAALRSKHPSVRTARSPVTL
jgi:hypothetical protein